MTMLCFYEQFSSAEAALSLRPVSNPNACGTSPRSAEYRFAAFGAPYKKKWSAKYNSEQKAVGSADEIIGAEGSHDKERH